MVSRVSFLLVCVGCSSTPRNAHPEWGQCGYAIHQHFVATDDPPKCRAGDLEACVRAAEVYRMGGYSVPQVPATSAELAWRACRGGNARGCDLLDEALGAPEGTCRATADACASRMCAARFDPVGLDDDARRAVCAP